MRTDPPAHHTPDEFCAPSNWQGVLELQDSLLVASHDLERLQRLLSGASEALMAHFCSASHGVNLLARLADRLPEPGSSTVLQLEQHLAKAVTVMQFQDLASQLIAHTNLRLRLCTDQLARELMGDDEVADAGQPRLQLRPNPVTQNEMHAGSIELF